MPIQAVFFDLDETLVRDSDATQGALRATALLAAARRLETEALARAVWLRALAAWERSPHQDYFQEFGISAGECLWGRFIGENRRLRPIRAWAIQFQLETWSSALADLGAGDDIMAETLAERFRTERRARHDWLFPDVIATLDRLRPTYALALITNGAPDIQRDKLTGSGLDPYFPVVQISCEAGAGKPDPLMFSLALDALGLAPSETLMVGDNPARDILGANRANVRAVWIRRDSQPLIAGARPDATIASLSELPALL